MGVTASIGLPVLRAEVPDHSSTSCYTRCPMKGMYQYTLSRAPKGENYPISFGVAYHKFREVLELLYKQQPRIGTDLLDPNWQKAVYLAAWSEAIKGGFVDPPIGHKKEFLTQARLSQTCNEAFQHWIKEKSSGRFTVLFTETAFDLALPSGRRYGGRFDQILEWNGRLWVRDFKTTSRMGRDYDKSFEPNHQMTGYAWAAAQLSGRPIDGVLVDVVYNTKTKGPTFHDFITTRSPFHVEMWIASVERELEEIERYHELDSFPMRTASCMDFGPCFFMEACKKSGWASVRDWLLEKTTQSKWDFMNPDAEEGVVD